jgi:septum site-determining protein MinC
MPQIAMIETTQDTAREAGSARRPLTIRSRIYTAIVLRPPQRGYPDFLAALDSRLSQAPNFFRDSPVVIDLQEIDEADRPFDLPAMVAELRRRSIHAVGVESVSDLQASQARSLGLPVLRGGRETALAQPRRDEGNAAIVREIRGGASKPKASQAEDRAAAAPSPAAPAAPAPTMIISAPVRSGQQIFADAGDLIVTAPVSPGAELIARGHIHCYAPMRGRAIAGCDGNAEARIFLHALEAELVAIAGLYKLSDDFDRALSGRPVQAFLKDDALLFQLLD